MANEAAKNELKKLNFRKCELRHAVWCLEQEIKDKKENGISESEIDCFNKMSDQGIYALYDDRPYTEATQ